MQATSISPASLSFLRVVRNFGIGTDTISHVTATRFDRRVNRVTRDEIASLFRTELGYRTQA